GLNHSEELRRSGCATAIVRNFLKIRTWFELSNAALCFRLSVPFHQESGIAVGELQHQGIIVSRLLGCGPVTWWRKRAHCHAAEFESVSFSRLTDRDALSHRLLEQSSKVCRVGRSTKPQFTRFEIGQDCVHSSQVIRVRVGESYSIQARDPTRPQVG